MKVNGQLRNAQLELTDDSQTAETKGRITFNKDCNALTVDTGSELKVILEEPVGEIKMWPTEVLPNGFLLCNGQAVSRTVYPKLFAVLGERYGVGNGTTTFELPDYRSQFIRGSDEGAGIGFYRNSRTDRGDGTVGDVVGTRQLDAFQDHDHSYITRDSNDGYPDGSGDTSTTEGPGYWTGRSNSTARSTTSASSISGGFGGTTPIRTLEQETTVKNVTVNFIIRAI